MASESLAYNEGFPGVLTGNRGPKKGLDRHLHALHQGISSFYYLHQPHIFTNIPVTTKFNMANGIKKFHEKFKS